ncbi:MAG: carboxymuconolactone decarboxylase family protein [Pseudomonadota bacterium]
MRPFPRRHYHGPIAPLVDLWQVLRRLGRARAVARGRSLGHAFRERLMLAVTEVNGCRWCSWFHAREALRAGLPQEEVARLLGGELALAPAEEQPALLYAQHWAEADTRPAADARARLVEVYGEHKAIDIELAMRMIRIGNLWGNTLDWALHWLSWGRWGAA